MNESSNLQQVFEEIIQLMKEWESEPIKEERAKLEKEIMQRGAWLNTETNEWLFRMSDVRAYAESRGEQ